MENQNTDPRAELPTLFFDSGVGGLSVLRWAVRIMPREDFIFYGDSANAPYGTKTADQIRSLTLGRVGEIYQEGIKAIVIACNTATSAAIRPLREIYTDIPVVGIEPALKPAAEMSDHPRVIVMATPLTVHAEKFHDLLGQYADRAEVIPLGCPGLMEFVESGNLEGSGVRKYLEDLLLPYLSQGDVDAIVLGCTHYPFLRETIRQVAGPGIRIFDGGEGTARELHRRLDIMHLLKPDAPGARTFRNPEDSPREQEVRKDTGKAGRIDYRESLPEKLALCRKLMSLPF